MSEPVCAVAADTKLETPEGAMTVKSVAGKNVSVFTRDDLGRVRFRLMLNVRKIADLQPVLKITLENGQSFRVGTAQVLFKKGMHEVPADAVAIGDTLEPAFHYPDGYAYHDASGQNQITSTQGWRVTGVENGGTADLYSLGVNQTGRFFLTAGVLCKADATG